MNWYRVTKTIRGHKYDYWQKTYRVGRSVKTINKYIGRADAPRGIYDPIPSQPCDHVWVDQITGEKGDFVSCKKCHAYRRGIADKLNTPTTTPVSKPPSLGEKHLAEIKAARAESRPYNPANVMQDMFTCESCGKDQISPTNHCRECDYTTSKT